MNSLRQPEAGVRCKCARCGFNGFIPPDIQHVCVVMVNLDELEKTRALLREAHRFLNAQAYEREEMEDFCRRLNDHLGIPNDSVIETTESK